MTAKNTKTERKTKQACNNPVNVSKRRKGRNNHVNDKNPVTGLLSTSKDGINKDTLTEIILDYIETWTARQKIDDLRKAEQPIFHALCLDIGKDIFKRSRILHSVTLVDNGSCAPTNSNQYDDSRLLQGADIYEYICSLYGKVYTLWSLCAFLGIKLDTFYNHADGLTLLGLDVRQKMESSLNDSIVSGKRNPTGSICILNAKFGYNAGTAGTTERIKETVVIYPKLIDIKQPQKALPDVVEQ